MDKMNSQLWSDWIRGWTAQLSGTTHYLRGIQSYNYDFLYPTLLATRRFFTVESERFFERSPEKNIESYYNLLVMTADLASRHNHAALDRYTKFQLQELEKLFDKCNGHCFTEQGLQSLSDYWVSTEETLRSLAEGLPEAIAAIEPEFGFHFELHPESLVAETDRFSMHKVAPSIPGVTEDENRKPILIIPPFVLGANILAFLPGEQKSYAHSFANKGIPTYIRLMKNIQENPAVQIMTLEDDALDTQLFCKKLKERHGLPVTLNGYCQGGFSSVCNLLSGKLDGYVDALITCVAPMDGTRSVGLGKFLHNLPQEFNDLAYGMKKLPSGNIVANGELMGWVYKLKSIEDSGPYASFLNDLNLVKHVGDLKKMNKTVLALNYWLRNERSDLPMAVTEMSFLSYTEPITEDGTLPVKMFGEDLNFKRLKEKKIPWLICYGESDDLVEKEVALAPLDFVDAETTPFPKGHVAIATSWSHPDSKCQLDKRFGPNKVRGPVRFQLDLEEELKA